MGPAAEAVRAAILAFFLNLGYQPFEANALVGHAWLETRLTPCAVGGAAHFLFQWEGARLRRLARFARTRGVRRSRPSCGLPIASSGRSRPIHAFGRRPPSAQRSWRCAAGLAAGIAEPYSGGR